MSPCLSSCIKSRLTHTLLGRLKTTIPNLWNYLQQKRILKSWGWGLTVHAGELSWVCGWTRGFRGLLADIFGIPESPGYAMMPRCRPHSRTFPHRRIYSLWSISIKGFRKRTVSGTVISLQDECVFKFSKMYLKDFKIKLKPEVFFGI